MTQKSLSRQARDKAKDDLEKLSWDDLNEINYTKKQMFASVTLTLGTMTKLPAVKFLTKAECEEAGSYLRQLGRDLGQMEKELNDAHKLHEGKSGKINLEDQEIWNCFKIFEVYEAWGVRLDAVTKPILDSIAAIIARGEARMIVASQEAAPAPAADIANAAGLTPAVV